MTPLTGLVGAILSAVALAVILTEACRRVALRYGVTDVPGPHKLHARPTPYLGGVALVAATLVPAVAVAAAAGASDSMILLAIAGLLVATIGLADDVKPLGMGSRLGVEAIAAMLVVLGGARLEITMHLWVDAALTVAWIVLLTNSFNLLDNMDAAAASMAGATAAVLGVAALFVGGLGGVALLLLCLAGSCAGFLWHNRPPARIFMGDAGSLFIGFMIALATLAFAPSGPVPVLTVLVLIGFGALVDTALVVISRQRAGRPWNRGGTDHVAHRLRRLGLSTAQAVGALAVAAALSGTLGVLVSSGVVATGYGLIVAVTAGVAAVLLLLKVPGYPRPVRRAPVGLHPGRGG
jgi:UDP-GlcNAc:undecaprenyl-phosphate GlcNAc-1-phosphate transferase